MTVIRMSDPPPPVVQLQCTSRRLLPEQPFCNLHVAAEMPSANTWVNLPSATEEQQHDFFRADLVREMTELRGYAIWLCGSGDLADDLIQETLLKAWLARDRFRAGTNFKAWCRTILRNGFYSYKRRSWRSQPLPDEESEALEADNADTSHMLDLLALRNSISLLPLDQREALIVVSVGGFGYIDAAKILECAVGTVKSRVSRARLRLTALVAENKAGFSSDASLSARNAMNDLMEQAIRITSRTGFGERYVEQSRRQPAVHSEPASQAYPTLTKRLTGRQSRPRLRSLLEYNHVR